MRCRPGTNTSARSINKAPVDTAANAQILRVYQLYYDQDFGATDVRFGIYDLETEFSTTKPEKAMRRSKPA